MELKRIFDYRAIMAIFCAAVFTFCILKYFETADAIQYAVSGSLEIPSIGLISDVADVPLSNGILDTPKTIVGSYSRHNNSTLLIGHSNTVFSDLTNVKIGDSIKYNGRAYQIYKSQIIEKESIDMRELLAEKDTDTIIVMTCFGQMYNDGDASHRMIIFASRA